MALYSRPFESSDGQRWQRTAFLAVSLVAVLLVVYWPSFRGAFVFDDLTSIVRNPNIRSIATSFSAPAEETVSGRPIASFTLAVNYAFAGGTDRVWGYHVVNFLIHACAALTLFGVVRRTLRSPRLIDTFGRRATPLAAVVALLWAVHPLTTSAVTYVVQRVESLMALFFLLTLYCAIRYIGQSGKGQEARGLPWLVMSIAACALGMATKEVMVGAPIVVWLWNWTFTKAVGHRPQAIEKPSGTPTTYGLWPTAFYLGLSATWLILAALVWHERRAHSVGAGLGEWTTWTYLLTQAGVIVHYVRLAIWPSPLVFDYAWPAAHQLSDVAPYVAALGIAVVLTIVGVIRRSPLAFLGAWFFITLAPSSSVLPIRTEVVAEHRMYLPLMALVSLVVLGAARLLNTQRAAVAVGVVAIVAALLGTLTFRRNLDYAGQERLWSDTVQKQPNNPRARLNYGSILLGRNAFEPAIEQLNQAVTIDPDSAAAHLSLALALCSERRIKEAEVHIARSIVLGHYTPEYQIKAANVLGAECGNRANR